MRLKARAISPGSGEGTARVSPAPFSFVGGADPATGAVLDDATGFRGERLAGRVLAFPHGKGSTVGSYVLYGLAKRGLGPAAVVNERAETIVATGAILGGVPIVDGVDLGGFAPGDRGHVDADRMTVDLPDVEVHDDLAALAAVVPDAVLASGAADDPAAATPRPRGAVQDWPAARRASACSTNILRPKILR